MEKREDDEEEERAGGRGKGGQKAVCKETRNCQGSSNDKSWWGDLLRFDFGISLRVNGMRAGVLKHCYPMHLPPRPQRSPARGPRTSCVLECAFCWPYHFLHFTSVSCFICSDNCLPFSQGRMPRQSCCSKTCLSPMQTALCSNKPASSIPGCQRELLTISITQLIRLVLSAWRIGTPGGCSQNISLQRLPLTGRS